MLYDLSMLPNHIFSYVLIKKFWTLPIGYANSYVFEACFSSPSTMTDKFNSSHIHIRAVLFNVSIQSLI